VGTSTIKSVRPPECEHAIVYRRNDEYAGARFNDRDDPIQCEGGVRYIAATIFAPPY